MANQSEIHELRKRVDALTVDELLHLSPEEMQAFVVTLRRALDKAQEARDMHEAGGSPEWERLST